MNNQGFRILIVDDDKAAAEGIKDLLIEEGYFAKAVSNARSALSEIRGATYDLIIADIVMPGMDGISLLKEIKSDFKNMEVIIITGFGSINSAVDAMKHGAFYYLTKPFNNLELKTLVKSAVKKKELISEVNDLKRVTRELGPYYPDLIGCSIAMRDIYQIMEKVSESDANLVITGETGTGKEVVAKAIHKNSHRKNGPFVPVNCKAIPETIFESELFGYEKGAFTDAKSMRKGYFESADGGILFLDEISEISPGIQAKLLRAIQDKQIFRLGQTRPIDVNLRIIAATNKNIEDEVRKGNIREDLYYRLNVVSIHLPPLRERASDIPLLAEHFLKHFQKAAKKLIIGLEPQCLALFYRYDWAGNVRELENAIEHAVTMCSGDIIRTSDIPARIRDYGSLGDIPLFDGGKKLLSFAEAKKAHTKHFCINYISKTLKRTNGNVTQAARDLKIARSHLNGLIKKYRIPVDKYKL